MKDSSAAGFHAINTRDLKKSQHIEAKVNGFFTNYDAVTLIEVPRPKAKFSPKERNKNVGIMLADRGDWTTILGRILGVDELEVFDSRKGVTVQ